MHNSGVADGQNGPQPIGTAGAPAINHLSLYALGRALNCILVPLRKDFVPKDYSDADLLWSGRRSVIFHSYPHFFFDELLAAGER